MEIRILAAVVVETAIEDRVNANTAVPLNWETITGIVLISDSELTVDTGATELLVGLGQSWYRDEQGFVVNVGDEVRIEGYEEDGEFKAAMVENLSLGTSIVLRDATGRPMWSGQSARNSRGTLDNLKTLPTVVVTAAGTDADRVKETGVMMEAILFRKPSISNL